MHVRWSRVRLHAISRKLRALVRADGVWLGLLAWLTGMAGGLAAVGISTVSQHLHEVLFRLPAGQRLSGSGGLDPLLVLLIPACGGLCLGVLIWAMVRWYRQPIVDVIEANALHGGRMSLGGSLLLLVQNLFSSGFGASVGLEASYTQIGGALGSRIAQAFRARRGDMRVLVASGVAGGITAAFNAPLAGAFYAFEIVLGSYTIPTLVPVVLGALGGRMVLRMLTGISPEFQGSAGLTLNLADIMPLLLLGVLCAYAGIAVMRGATLVEALFRRTNIPALLQPMIGGVLLGALALMDSHVLSAGHGALEDVLEHVYLPHALALIFVMKALACSVSLGAGFRGGLFFASLFLGALLGKLFAAVMLMLVPAVWVSTDVSAWVGMAAMAVAIVGGPFTMTFLVLEGTGNLSISVAVLAAAILSTQVVRQAFGFSFATWRFHLRGEGIRSAEDIGWLRSLTVERLMQRNIHTMVAEGATLPAFCQSFPLGAVSSVIVTDHAGRYIGIVHVPEAHAALRREAELDDLLRHRHSVLLPHMPVQQAMTVFDKAEGDVLAVVSDRQSRAVIGLLSEAHALRRYTEEFDRYRYDSRGA